MEKKEYKLTLSVEKEIVEKAKVYASEEHNSISSLVTDFLETYIAMKSSENNPSKGDNSHASKFAGIISLKKNKSNQTDIAAAILDKHKKRFK